MHKRVFIVHGWEGYPEEGWFPWLKRELEAKGFEVHVPAMPHPNTPTIDDWVRHLAKIVKNPNEGTLFIGHSIGCQTILRYVQTLPIHQDIGGIVCVAGWLRLKNLRTDEERALAQPWLDTQIDFEGIRKRCSKIVAIFSDDDKWVPIEDKKLFEEKLNAKTILENKKGHLSGYDGITELPSVLASVLKMTNNCL